MKDLPVACSLTPEALRARRDGLLGDLARRAQSREDLPDGVRLRFESESGSLATIAEAVEAERHCCRFLRFVIVVEAGGGSILLDLTGPPGTGEFLTSLLP
jgi:hypothetical protein